MLRNSPLLEIYKKKGIEVLLLDDDIDEIVFSNVDKYGDIDLKSVNKSTPDELKDDSAPEQAAVPDVRIPRPNPADYDVLLSCVGGQS